MVFVRLQFGCDGKECWHNLDYSYELDQGDFLATWEKFLKDGWVNTGKKQYCPTCAKIKCKTPPPATKKRREKCINSSA